MRKCDRAEDGFSLALCWGEGGSLGDVSPPEGILWRLASWGVVVAIPLIWFLLALSLYIEQTS